MDIHFTIQLSISHLHSLLCFFSLAPAEDAVFPQSKGMHQRIFFCFFVFLCFLLDLCSCFSHSQEHIVFLAPWSSHLEAINNDVTTPPLLTFRSSPLLRSSLFLDFFSSAFPVTDHKNDVNDLRSCCVANYSYVHLMGHLLEQSQHGG